MNKKQKSNDDSCKPKRGAIDIYAVQCDDCQKWRTIATREEYEKLRSNFNEERFVCNSQLNISCDDPPDIDYDTTRTWVIDKPNLPVTPEGFKRELILRPDYSKLDAHYTAPEGKKLRCQKELVKYLQKHPELSHLKIEDFNFTAPKIMEETIPEDARKMRLEKSVTKNKKDNSPRLDGKKKTTKTPME